MELEQAARESGLVRPEHLQALLRSLTNRTFGWLVCDPSRRDERLQGNLVSGLPVAIVAPDGTPRCKPFTTMVINNVCDLQPGRSECVTVAPVQEFDRFAEGVAANGDPGRTKNFLDDVRRNQVDGLFYIPHCPQLPKGGVVRFDRLASMSANIYEQSLADGRRLASLTQSGFYFLLMKLTRFLVRPESPDVARESP